jgi:hypothetical protein
VFVLIPGAGVDPRVFGVTISALADIAHEAVPLPLHHERATPNDHADGVARAVRGRSELVVVTQSLGAFSGALVPARIPVAHLVLVAPMIPKPGETAGEWWQNTAHSDAIASLAARQGEMSQWGPEAIEEVFLHDVDPEVARERLGVDVDVMTGGHLPTLSRPRELAERLVGLTGGEERQCDDADLDRSCP